MRGPDVVTIPIARARARISLLMMLMAALVAIGCLTWNTAAAAVGNEGGDVGRLHTGRDLYHAACVACHGADGSGAPETMIGFQKPATFPDFTQCDQTAPEYTRDWQAVIRDGGPARGFSEIMPAFGDVFTPEQISQLAQYLRSLCGQHDKKRRWPAGELNLPRALLTEKAFPEDEVVLTTSIATRGTPGIANDFTYEYRIDGRNQLEVALPVDAVHQDTGGYNFGIGDLALGLKHVFFWDLDAAGQRGSIFAVQTEIVLPTGDSAKGLGTGEAALGVFGSYDVLLPRNTFLQFQAGGQFPRHTQATPNSVYARSAFGASFSRGFGRQWSPMFEVVADRDLHSGATTNWSAVPEFQVTVNTRQHIRAALGYRVALNNRADHGDQVVFYFLWDWFDGGLFEGW